MPIPKKAAIENPEILISVNPATGVEIGRLAVTAPIEVTAAVNRGREAFSSWRSTSFVDRSRLIMKAREVILADLDRIAELISQESGKPVAEAISMEIAPVLDLMQHFARKTEKLLAPKNIGIGLYGLMGRSSQIIYHPLGVVGIIPAWNYPFSIPLGEAVMAVMSGNTVVIKPSELTPFIGLKIGEIFQKAGLPANVVQVITGGGSTGAALVEAATDKIMFTGSVATGKKIAKAAAESLTSVVLELGGKDPMIVFDDANLDLAARAAVWGAFCNSGQSCSSVERLYVHEKVAKIFTDKVVSITRQLKQGASGDSVSIGAMSSERQIQIVERHVDEFVRAGAKVEIGGKRHNVEQVSSKVEQSDRSLFYEPTVITGATNEMLPMREETFGPTLPIASFNTEDEAIKLANDSEFGLTASVWTRDRARGLRVARQIEAGSVSVNEVLYTHGIGQTPWGGFKNSGRGRTHGHEGLMEMVQPQHIHVNRLSTLPDPWWMPYSSTAIDAFRGFATKFASGSLIKTVGLLPVLARRILELRKR
jgi:acyl-CoA reductase-like NAD-dependent aldehyde dehydrogenase